MVAEDARLDAWCQGKENQRDPENVETTPLLWQKGSPVGASVPPPQEDSDDLLPPSSSRHYPFLDITRICCVCFVAIDHGNSNYGVWNVLFAQDWVLQYLFLVCGVSYGLSSKGLGEYELRLATYCFIGIGVNLAAWVITGMNWMSNFFNVVFQMWFVVGLMGYAALLAPLRSYLARVRALSCAQAHGAKPTPEAAHSQAECEPTGTETASSRDVFLRIVAVIGGGILTIFLVFKVCANPLIECLAPLMWRISVQFGDGAHFWGLPENLEQSTTFLGHFCTYLMLTCSNVYLIVVCPQVFKRCAITAWAVLINTYTSRLLFFRAKEERPFHGLDLMMIGLTTYYLGLLHRRKIGLYLTRYWFLVLFVCALLWPPDEHGRFDENPTTDPVLRVRINLLEAIFVVMWLAAGERLVQPQIFTEDRLDFMNYWALLVFLIHKAVHILLAPPLNWIALVAFVPLCYTCCYRK